MAWTRHFQTVDKSKRISNLRPSEGLGSTTSVFSSVLTEVYAGHPQRIERYSQYDVMDQDSEVNASLDTIADFSTKIDDATESIFEIKYHEDPSEAEIEILKTTVRQWTNLNDFQRRLWRIFRNTLKYGDQFFIRDPETFKWYWVDPAKVEKILVDETKGKKPEAYVIHDLDLNLQGKVATKADQYGQNIQGTGTTTLQNLNTRGFTPRNSGANNQSRFNNSQNATIVDAAHVVHFSLSEGLDANWPFGTSILEPVFKVFKQKELLEDAIVIYRVQRAPERRVFYVDVGDIDPRRAQSYIEKVKMDIHQRRIPTRTGGGESIVDAAYNPLSMMEDYFFAQTPSGRGSRVETLPGGENLGQIDDLKYFNNKLVRGLRVPSSYLPTGPDDGTASYNDGKVGTAYIQEYRFANYCQRLQMLIASTLDDEFKLFVKNRGFNIEASLFEIGLNPPQNFRQFEQLERDTATINVFQPLADVKYLSKRFLLKRFLGLSDEEITKNEQMWLEENPGDSQPTDSGNVGTSEIGLDSMGFRDTDEDFSAEEPDMEDMDTTEPTDEPVDTETGDEGFDLGEV